ncbi:MAG: flagellar basal body P-ring formation chaperone FlgA [Helicobacteraceae bacterium]|nr:flagellar basal body P-ring formation chaperone FlgA [Helicobacteraceae bacterium]
MEDSYLINDNTILASHIVTIKQELDFAIDRFDSKSSIQLPLNKLKRIFGEHNITIDSRYPVITFHNFADFDPKPIIDALTNRFIEAYPTIEIDDITIKPASFIDANNLQIAQVDVSQNALKRNKGSFAVWFGSENAKVKRAFFTFEIDATIRALQASKQIARGTIIAENNCDETIMAFEAISAKPIDRSLLGKVAAKSRLNKGDIITDRSIAIIPDVRKNSQITIELIKNGVKISFIGSVEKDADIGELVNVRDREKRVFTARIISKDIARIE